MNLLRFYVRAEDRHDCPSNSDVHRRLKKTGKILLESRYVANSYEIPAVGDTVLLGKEFYKVVERVLKRCDLKDGYYYFYQVTPRPDKKLREYGSKQWWEDYPPVTELDDYEGGNES